MKLFSRFRRRQPSAEAAEFDSTPGMAMEETATPGPAARQALHSHRPQLRARGAAFTEEDLDESIGLPAVNRRRSSTGKLVNVVGMLVILLLGAVMIYTINTPKVSLKASDASRVERVENNLPPLAIAPPPPLFQAGAPVAPAIAPEPSTLQPIPVMGGNATSAAVKPALDWTERKRAGSLMVGSTGTAAGLARPVTDTDSAAPPPATASSTGTAGASLDGGGRSEFGGRLEPTVLKGASAALLPDRNFLLTQGTTLDCALETALDSTLPGMATCRLTRDIYSDNGQVLLLDRGTQLVGEYQGGMKQGQNRLFVLWSRAKTPKGVVIALNSPGTDALGRSGLEGWVDAHFAERFGAAILFSLFRDTTAYLVARGQNNGGTIVYGNTQQSGEQAVGKILDSSINIPPTLVKNQGDHIQVMIARDLDFSTVYGLREK